MKGLVELTRMRLLLLLRQPEILFWVFAFPVIMTVVLGLAFESGGEAPSRVALVADETFGAELSLETALREHAELELLVVDADEAERLLRTGAVDVVVRGGAEPELRFDPDRAEAAAARLRVAELLQRAAGRVDALELRETRMTARGSRYVDWFVPGMLGFGVMNTSIWAVAFAFVETRQKHLLKRLLVTPMSRAAFLMAPVLARLCVLVLEVAILMAFAVWMLEVPFQGSLVAFSLLCLLGSLAFAGLGILLGSRARTPEAASGLINLATIPMTVACGVFFSYERFAEALHPWIRALPLTAFNDAIRKLMLEGRGLGELWLELLVLGVWGLGGFALGLLLFRWK